MAKHVIRMDALETKGTMKFVPNGEDKAKSIIKNLYVSKKRIGDARPMHCTVTIEWNDHCSQCGVDLQDGGWPIVGGILCEYCWQTPGDDNDLVH